MKSKLKFAVQLLIGLALLAFAGVKCEAQITQTPQLIQHGDAIEIAQNAPSLPINIPTVGDAITNLPSASSFTNAQFELNIGTRANQLNVENVISLQYNFVPSFFVQGEIQNGPASTVIDVAGLNIGARKAWDTAEIYGFFGGRRDWIAVGGGKPAWEVVFGGGAKWRPVDGTGLLSKLALYAEGLGVVSQSSKRAGIEGRAGICDPF